MARWVVLSVLTTQLIVDRHDHLIQFSAGLLLRYILWPTAESSQIVNYVLLAGILCVK